MRNIFLPIFLIVIAIGLFLTYTDVAYKDVKKMEQDEMKYDEALSKSKELQIIRDDLLSRYNALKPEDVSRLKKLLPDNVDNVRLVLEIDNIAAKYGMKIKGVSISREPVEDKSIAEVKTKKFDAITLSFSVNSSYGNFIKFVQDLENSLRIVDIVRISFTSSNADFNEYDLSIKTYWVE